VKGKSKQGMNDFSADPDIGLILRAGKGDRKAFEEIVVKYQKSILNTAYRYTGNPSVAEDLAQEVFVRVFRAAPAFKPTARFSTWLFTIVRNICSNYRQREGRFDHQTSTDLDLNLTPTHQESPETLLIRQERARTVQKAIHCLPSSLKMPLILNQFNQMSYEEIAKVMKISLTAVKVRIHRAKQSLAERLLLSVEKHEETATGEDANGVTGQTIEGLK
jgi:RNA polymerase sigma-70 factor (ECF subfamily)